MARAEPTNIVTASSTCGSEDEGGSVREASSSSAGAEYAPASASKPSLSQSLEDVTARMSEMLHIGSVRGLGSVREASSSVAGDVYGTASASMPSSSQSFEYVTAGMSETQLHVRRAIEKSREQGWSELANGGQAAAAGSPSAQDALIWEELKRRDSRVFRDGVEVQLGRLIAEGGQAHIYEAKFKVDSGLPKRPNLVKYLGGGGDGLKFVAKVYKMEGFTLADLQRLWPLATQDPEYPYDLLGIGLVSGEVAFGEWLLNCSRTNLGTFLKDGRFAFLMPKYWGDLRTLIDLKLSHNNLPGAPPFSHHGALKIMREIAKGIVVLHARGVLHRDPKAANILLEQIESGHLQPNSPIYFGIGASVEDFIAIVVDFESAMLVQGIGFWRALEILKELQKKVRDRNAKIWTEEVDTYSFAMVYYELLIGHIPFFGYDKRDWKRVIDGERPHLPDHVDPEVRELIEKCWHSDASETYF